jgi:long-chain acyl-CoA synthetase
VVASGGVNPAALRAFCGERLAPFKVPRRIHVVDAIPKGPTGKVQRTTLGAALDA